MQLKNYFLLTVSILITCGCANTKTVKIKNLDTTQKISVDCPPMFVGAGVEIPIVVTVQGETDGEAYVYMDHGVPFEIQSRSSFAMKIHKGKNHLTTNQQTLVGQRVNLIYHTISAKQGELEVEVKF